MKHSVLFTLAALAAQKVAAHATFQELWVNGVDKISVVNLSTPTHADS